MTEIISLTAIKPVVNNFRGHLRNVKSPQTFGASSVLRWPQRLEVPYLWPLPDQDIEKETEAIFT